MLVLALLPLVFCGGITQLDVCRAGLPDYLWPHRLVLGLADFDGAAGVSSC